MLFIFKTLIEERIIVDCKVLVKVIQIEFGTKNITYRLSRGFLAGAIM